MIKLGELISKLKHWEDNFGPDCEVSIDWNSLYKWEEDRDYTYVTDISIVDQNEICIEFD